MVDLKKTKRSLKLSVFKTGSLHFDKIVNRPLFSLWLLVPIFVLFKEPLTPSGAEEDEKRGDGSCCPEEEEEDEEGDDEDEGTEGEEVEGVKLIRGEGRTEEEEEEETDAAEELEDDRQNKAESSDHRASSEEDSQLHSYA